MQEDSRAQTCVLRSSKFVYQKDSYVRQIRLATLDAFLDSQRQLISRTQADLQKLTVLREKALKDPVSFIENADNEVGMISFSRTGADPIL